MNCLTCGKPTEDHVGFSCPEVSESRLIDLLAAFRRYVDGCKTYANCDWDDEKIRQWEEDKKFRINAYNSKRNVSFSEASTYAQEQLFLRCVGAATSKLTWPRPVSY